MPLSNSKIGYFCVIENDVIVGDNVEIGNYVLLKGGTVIGDNCFIDSYVRSSGHNRIGNNVTIRFGATIARQVVIEDNVFISPNVMTIYSGPGDYARGNSILIKKGVYIGTAAVIGTNVIIGENVIIGANSFVNKDCLERGTYVGNPVRRIS